MIVNVVLGIVIEEDVPHLREMMMMMMMITIITITTQVVQTFLKAQAIQDHEF